MSAAELSTVELSPLSGMADGHLNVPLGVGASAAAQLPDWNGLAETLLTSSGAIADSDTAAAFIATQDPSLAAEAARASTADWMPLVRAALYPNGEPDPAVLHLATAALTITRTASKLGLFTLNFDLLLERALRRALDETGRDPTQVVRRSRQDRTAQEGQYEVQHLHGYIGPDPGDDDAVVLTLSDFADLNGRTRPW